MHLSTDWPDGVARRILDEVDSTNAEAMRSAPALTGPTWILALRQTAGRGRRGRPWQDPRGNFAATLALPNQNPAGQAALRSFVAALALYDAFKTATGRPAGFRLKWPNDVLLNGGKVAGILLERVELGGGASVLAIGIGVNLLETPASDGGETAAFAPVGLMSETGARLNAEEFLDILAPAFAHWDQQFTTYGFDPIRRAWLSRAAKLGETIIARTQTEDISGVFETVDAEGNLVLSTAKGRRAIPAAEVFF